MVLNSDGPLGYEGIIQPIQAWNYERQTYGDDADSGADLIDKNLLQCVVKPRIDEKNILDEIIKKMDRIKLRLHKERNKELDR